MLTSYWLLKELREQDGVVSLPELRWGLTFRASSVSASARSALVVLMGSCEKTRLGGGSTSSAGVAFSSLAM
jgi:hypothetical protein